MVNEQAAPWYRQFGLKADPFSSQKDFFYTGARRQEQLQALEHLCYYGDLVVLLQGEKGAGKTTLVEQLMAHCQEKLPTALIQPNLLAGGKRLLEQIVQALPPITALPRDERTGAFGQITEYLRIQVEAGRRTLLIVEDADTLSEEAVDLLARHFQPLVAAGQLALILTAGPGFDGLWRRRVTDPQSFYKLELAPLTGEDVAHYMAARLQIGGWNGTPPLPAKALQGLARQSQGNFAAIERLAPSLLGALPAASKPARTRTKPQGQWLALAALLLLASFGLAWLLHQEEEPSSAEPSVAAGREVIAQPDEPLIINWPEPEPPPAWAVDDQAPLASNPEVPVPDAPEQVEQPTEPAEAGEEKAAVVPPDVAPVPDADQSAASRPEQAENPAPVVSAPVETTPKAEPPAAKSEAVAKPPTAQRSPQHSAFRDRAWLMARPSSRYTIQLLGSYNEQTARTLIDDIKGVRNLWYVKTIRKEQDWFVVLHGEYPDRDAARAAVNKLPSQLKKLQPWVRPFRDVQADAGS